MKHYKVLFVYPDDYQPSEYKIESLWSEKIGDLFKVDNIPFFAKNIAVGDIIKVEYDEEDKSYYFDELVEASGNSVIRIVPLDKSISDEIGKELLSLGCDWESLENGNLIAVHVPKEVPYEKVKSYLDEGSERVDYQEACLGIK